MKVSLRLKISWIISIVIGVGGGLAVYLVYVSSTGALKTSINSGLSATASQTMDKIDRYLYERTNDLQSLAGRQRIQGFLAQSASARSMATANALSAQMEDYKKMSGSWSAVTILDTKGNLALPSADPEKLGDSLAKQLSIVQLYASAVAGHAGYSDALTIVRGRPPVMLFMTPVRDEIAVGKPVVGVLVGEVSWESNLQILSGLGTTKATLINRNGLSLGDNDSGSSGEVLALQLRDTPVFNAARQHKSGSGIFPGLEDPEHQFLTTYVPEKGHKSYKGNGWTLVLETPTSVAFAPTRQLTQNLLIIYVSALIGSIAVLIIAMERQVIRPLTLLKDAAEKLPKEDLAEPVRITSHDELGDLSAAFNTMAAKLHAVQNDLRFRAEDAESEQRLVGAVLHSLPVGVVVVDASSHEAIMMNKAGGKLSGYALNAAEDEAERPYHPKGYEAINEDGSPYSLANHPINQALKTKKAVTKDDMILRRPDGSTLAVRTIAAPIKEPNGKVERVIAVFEDITSQQELERSREEFFSIASHELRTPLTAIRGNIEMVNRMFGGKLDDPEFKGMVADIHESSVRLIDIVNDFLDTSRLEQKRMTFELQAMDVVATAESVIKEYQVTGSRQKTHLEVTIPAKPLPKVRADTNRVKQVIINLVGNALRFTERGSVTISFEVLPGYVKVLITDTGRGMDAEAQKILFRKFGQAGSNILTRESVRSTGLGLYISKLIIEQLHGHIKLESSTVGVGTCFSFTLPTAPDVRAPNGK